MTPQQSLSPRTLAALASLGGVDGWKRAAYRRWLAPQPEPRPSWEAFQFAVAFEAPLRVSDADVERAARERIARIISPDRWHEAKRYRDVGDHDIADSLVATSLAKADAILALRSESPRWSGWFVEREGKWWAAAPHTRWQLQQYVNDLFIENWTFDPNEALRFARKEDAEALIKFEGWQKCEVTEHVWLTREEYPDLRDPRNIRQALRQADDALHAAAYPPGEPPRWSEGARDLLAQAYTAGLMQMVKWAGIPAGELEEQGYDLEAEGRNYAALQAATSPARPSSEPHP